MIVISNLILNVEEGSTVAATEIYGIDKKTYINIGSGNVFKLSWNTPTMSTDIIDSYSLVIKRHDTSIDVYYDIFNKNIGLVNQFAVDSPLLPSVPDQYMLSMYVVAYGKYGSIITSNIVNPYISKGSGTYIKVEGEGYAQPIMKRAIAFVKVLQEATGIAALACINGQLLKSVDDKVLFAHIVSSEATLADSNGIELEDAAGVPLFADAATVLESEHGWNIVKESYTKDTGNWHTNNIEYEVLIDDNGEIITDANNMPIYVL